MQQFTPYEYTKIAVANAFGKDKVVWDSRLKFADSLIDIPFEEQLDIALNEAKEPMLAVKALHAVRDAQNGVPSGFLVNLDCTASGLQIMAALTGCKKTAARVNLINTGNRENVYDHMAQTMRDFGCDVDADIMKAPTMTVFYGSTEQPKSIFGEDTKELAMFYKTLEKDLTGAWNMLNTVQSVWNPEWLRYGFTLPDNHTVDIPVMCKKDFKIEIAEFFKRTFTFRTSVNCEKDYSRELCANVTHAVDGYIVRRMYALANEQGWELATIHDSFWCLPNYVNYMRQNFVTIMVDIAKSDLLTQILRDLTGKNAIYEKYSQDLHLDILKSEYALS